LDERKKKQTPGDLMSMTSGFECDDTNPAAPGNESVMMDQTEQLNWTRYTVDLPMSKPPGGSTAVYCSVDMNLTAAIVANATGIWLPDYFDAVLAQPLQFGAYYWNLTPTGEGYGGGAYVMPRDGIKLGQLFLDGGVWNGRRVVSQHWIDMATTPHCLPAATITTRLPGALTYRK
jgi:CubicO group peptidase (beta-lactamase class C family)